MIGLDVVRKGTYWRIYHLGRQLSKMGHSITITVTSQNERWKLKQYTRDGITLIETPDLFKGPLRSGWDPWNVANRILWLSKQRFDLVHAFESRPTVIFPALYYAHRRKIPLIIDWADWFGRHGSVEERQNYLIRTILRPVETFFEQHYRDRADGTTVICTALREKALELKIDPTTILLLPNGSDIENLSPLPVNIARAKLGISDDNFIIGYIGSIFQKDVELMLNAFKQVLDTIPTAQLLLIGNSKIKNEVLRDLSQKIIQTGYVDEAIYNDFLAVCDIFWLPLCDMNANRGRLPLKLHDYLAAGRPIVATAVGDLPIYFIGEQIGLLCDPTPDDIAAKTARLYQNDGLRRKMGVQARWQAENLYSWHKIALQLESFYKKTIQL